MHMPSITLKTLPQTLAICTLQGRELPGWCAESSFLSFTRTGEETSLVCDQACVPSGVTTEPDWRAFCIDGTLDFSLTGILARLSTTLAERGIPLFAVSTYDTDYILVKEDRLSAATAALTAAGYTLVSNG